MDAGDVLVQVRIPLNGSETTGSLTRHAAYEGALLVSEALRMIETGTARPVPQREEEASYCSLITKEDGEIEWSRSAVEIERMIRAYDPWPRAYTSFRGSGLTIREGSVFEAGINAVPDAESSVPGFVSGIDKEAGILVKTGKGIIALKRLQLHAKKPLEWKAFLNGVRDFIGTILGGGIK